MKDKKMKLKTIIGKNCTFEGNLATKGGLLINGQIKGSVTTDGFVSIGVDGNVTANIKCKECFISGKIKGNIEAAASIHLEKTAEIEGDLIACQLEIENGAILNGNCSMTTPVKDK